jgi:hypothetical protein
VTLLLEEMQHVVRVLRAEYGAPRDPYNATTPIAVVYYQEDGSPRLLEEAYYWLAPRYSKRFEESVARKLAATEVTRWVFGTRFIMAEDDTNLLMRPAEEGFPPRPFEQEVLWLVAVDLTEGVEVGRVVIRDGLFGELECIVGDAQMLEGAPGFRLMQAVLEGVNS